MLTAPGALGRLAVAEEPTEEKGMGSVLLYPNPAKEVLHIDLSGANAVSAKVLDITGKPLQTILFGENRMYDLPTSGLKAGMYFLHFQSGTVKTVHRFIVD